jgi:ergothioneine biosynthesis protein EgtB
VSLERLRRAWRRSDRLLGLLADSAWLEQPIRLRQPFLFYLGHLPAFAWNHLGRRALGLGAFRPDLDELFERGIDPVGVDAYETRSAWPERAAVLEYRDRGRAALEDALGDPGLSPEASAVLAMVIEHELMHHETLLYMVQELDHGLKARPSDWPALPAARAEPGAPARSVEVPRGEAVLGAPRGAIAFGWDNEFPEHRLDVPAFAIDERPVTNADLLEFVRDGAYAEPRLWGEGDWAWRERRRLVRPHAWVGEDGRLAVRALLEDVPFAAGAEWPAQVSHAEASAYARWRGARLPTEAEWHRAARGTPAGSRRRWPWGDEPPDARRANVGFDCGSPTPVGCRPDGASAWGVLELLGNGWEWTKTPFVPFPGFEPMAGYPGYSADFFDDAHFVLLGGSWATDEALLRPSFRNWFQPHYPYVFSKFRCARSL